MKNFQTIINDLREFTMKKDAARLKEYCEENLNEEWEHIITCAKEQMGSPRWEQDIYDQPEILLDCLKEYLKKKELV